MQESTDEDNKPCLTCFLLPQMPVDTTRSYLSNGLGNYGQTYRDLSAPYDDYNDPTDINEQRRTLLFSDQNQINQDDRVREEIGTEDYFWGEKKISKKCS